MSIHTVLDYLRLNSFICWLSEKTAAQFWLTYLC